MKGLQKIDGYHAALLAGATGKLFMEIGRFNQEMLYQVVAAGRPRFEPGRARSRSARRLQRDRVRAHRPEGPDGAAELPLPRHQHERRGAACGRGFVRAERALGLQGGSREGARVLVDATAFFMRDAHGVVDRLRQTKQGSYKLDDSRSALYMPRTKGFPKNTEVETILTFTTDDDPGRRTSVRRRPSPAAVTLREHHSFVELPDLKYKPRQARSARPVVRHRVLRLRVADHRAGREALDRAPPTREEGSRGGRVRAVEPIVYYVDSGAPEPIRSRAHRRARRGGTRRSRRPASATRSRSRCCPPTPTRWTSATT